VNILIAGNTGVIGSYLTDQLSYNNCSTIDSDVLDLTSKQQSIDYAKKSIKYNVLIFLVGLAHSKGKNKNYNNFELINYSTLFNLLSSFNRHNKIPDKIIFASTISVYGEKVNNNIYDESIMPDPYSPYAKTKLLAEKYLIQNYGSQSWILRFAPVYSNKFKLNIDRRTKIGKLFYRVGNGSKKLSICNINNINSAIDGIINNLIPAGVYNISDNTSYNYNELLKWQGASFTIRVPKIIVQFLFYCGKLFRNIFLQENTIKLFTDNIYPNNKIRSFIKLPYVLNDLELNSREI